MILMSRKFATERKCFLKSNQESRRGEAKSQNVRDSIEDFFGNEIGKLFKQALRKKTLLRNGIIQGRSQRKVIFIIQPPSIHTSSHSNRFSLL